MYEFKDLAGRTKAATIAVTIWLLLDVSSSVGNYLNPNWDVDGDAALTLLNVINFVALIVAIILVSRWIYRACANAHSRSDDLEITPGWAVGWYFIPIASFFKPHKSMKEIWLQSQGLDVVHGDSPDQLNWWWGLWVTSNIVNNIGFRMEMSGNFDLAVSANFYLIGSALSVPVTYLLVRLMNEVTTGQVAEEFSPSVI